MNFKQALDKAKITLMSTPDAAFYTYVLFSLKLKEDPTCKTAYVDGEYIGINPEWFLSLDPEERVFLLIHEAMHVAYLHIARQGNRNQSRFNIAGDHVINLQLVNRGFKMPTGGYADPQYNDLSTEQVYDLLPESTPQDFDMDIRCSEKETDTLRREVEDILIAASVASAMAGDAIGSIPGDIQIFLSKLLSPKLPWNRIMHRYLRSLNQSDYSFKKPNRRYFPEHYMPSLWGQSLIDLAIAVDISGSVTDNQFTQFISEITSLFRMMKPETMTLIQFDTKLHSIDKIQTLRELSRVTFKGRGGTRIEPVIEWANENKPQLLLIFTDGGFRFYGPEAKGNTVWLIHNNKQFQSPFGKVIHYEV